MLRRNFEVVKPVLPGRFSVKRSPRFKTIYEEKEEDSPSEQQEIKISFGGEGGEIKFHGNPFAFVNEEKKEEKEEEQIMSDDDEIPKKKKIRGTGKKKK